MSEPEKRDHWANLVDLVGADPPPKTEQPIEPVAPIEAAPVAVQTPDPALVAPKRKVEPPRRVTSDWGQLAAELGLPPAPAPVAPPPARVCVPKPEFVAPPLAVEPVRVEPEEPEIDVEAEEQGRVRAEAWQSQLVELSDPVFLDSAEGEALGATEAAEGEAVEEIPSVGETEQAEGEQAGVERGEQPERGERRRRRKKRRRRRPGEGPGQGEERPRIANEPESVPADTGPAEEYLEEVLANEPGAPAEAAGETEAEGERREGRKRRRRRRKKRSGEAAAPAAAEGEPSEPQTETCAEPGDEHDDDSELEHDVDAEGEEGDESSGRLSHRAIPTWDQAIGLIIARNMEARAKHPNGPSRRGGKGRRPDRGRS